MGLAGWREQRRPQRFCIGAGGSDAPKRPRRSAGIPHVLEDSEGRKRPGDEAGRGAERLRLLVSLPF